MRNAILSQTTNLDIFLKFGAYFGAELDLRR
jgi:hypothetical protein